MPRKRRSPDRFITADGSKGRLVEVISRGEPACFLAHWTGIHHNGTKAGFQAFQEVVRRLNAKYDHLVWMKLSEVARYWAARELTRIDVSGAGAAFTAPYACPAFTVRLTGEGNCLGVAATEGLAEAVGRSAGSTRARIRHVDDGSCGSDRLLRSAKGKFNSGSRELRRAGRRVDISACGLLQ